MRQLGRLVSNKYLAEGEVMQQQGTSTPFGATAADPTGAASKQRADNWEKQEGGCCPEESRPCADERVAAHPQAQQPQQTGGGGAPGTGSRTDEDQP